MCDNLNNLQSLVEEINEDIDMCFIYRNGIELSLEDCTKSLQILNMAAAYGIEINEVKHDALNLAIASHSTVLDIGTHFILKTDDIQGEIKKENEEDYILKYEDVVPNSDDDDDLKMSTSLVETHDIKTEIKNEWESEEQKYNISKYEDIVPKWEDDDLKMSTLPFETYDIKMGIKKEWESQEEKYNISKYEDIVPKWEDDDSKMSTLSFETYDIETEIKKGEMNI